LNIEAKKHAHLRRKLTHSTPAAFSGSLLRFIVGTIVITLAGTGGAFAYEQIHRQIDAATGITTYTYNPSSADRKVRGSPPPVPRHTQDKGLSRIAVSAPQKTPMRLAPADGITLSSYSDFPRVSAETQKARDSERRRILKHELAWEQAALDQAIVDKDPSEVLQRHRENIESLHREIRNMQ
jgi:hypothetical protein